MSKIEAQILVISIILQAMTTLGQGVGLRYEVGRVYFCQEQLV